MTMKAFFLASALLFSVPLLSQAQTLGGNNNNAPKNEETTSDGFWEGRLKGGTYIVRSDAIIALSKHEYIADGVARVVEVNLSLNTSMVVRFYFLEPIRLEGGGSIGAAQGVLDKARGLATDVAGKVSPTLTEPKVVKNYPVSTHSHTIEFLIQDESRLNSLFTSLDQSMRNRQGRIWYE